MKVMLRWVIAFVTLAFAGQASELPDGTLLFVENCSSVVERSTHGEIAHVALVFHDGDERWVYEATPAKVRRVKFGDYLLELGRSNQRRKASDQIGMIAVQPHPVYSAEEVAKMRSFLNGQVGRRYSVKNYIRGKEYDGIHCAELASNALNQSDRYALPDCHKISPQALYGLVVSTYSAPQRLTIPSPEVTETWTARWQRRTLGWLTWCRWSWREAWLFLW